MEQLTAFSQSYSLSCKWDKWDNATDHSNISDEISEP